MVKRVRPCHKLDDEEQIIHKPKYYSFPSGHTLASFEAATVLMIRDRRLGIPALILSVIIAFSRLYLYVHYPTDVLGGALCGTLCGLTALFLWTKRLDRDIIK